MTKIIFVLFLLGFVFPVHSGAACDDWGVARCRQARLDAIDQEINAEYRRLMQSLRPEVADQLKLEQRGWIRQRNDACDLSQVATQKTNWIAFLSQDKSKSLCVIGAMELRLRDLRVYRVDQLRSDKDLIERQEITSPVSHRTGKWYAEVEVFAAAMAKRPSILLQVGVENGEHMIGMQIHTSTLTAAANTEGRYVVGIATDLDNGKVYYAENGIWRDGAPNSAQGTDIKLGKDVAFRVHASAPIAQDLAYKVIDINLGTRPFKYPLSAGYLPFYGAMEGDNVMDWIVPIYTKPAGQSYNEWALKYWAWLLSKQPDHNPTQDSTGQYCADGQSGDVWFLAGGDAKSRMTRSCKIPRGKFLLLPAVVQLLSSRVGSVVCADAQKQALAKDGADAIAAAFVTINGHTFNSLKDYKLYTPGCVTIQGADSRTLSTDALFYGVWILLRPLPPGEHVISFGGQIPKLNTDRGVSYKLSVE